MNTKNIAKNLIAGLLLTSAVGAAMAEASRVPETKFVSTKTRADVIAELQQARANGEMVVSNRYPADKPMTSVKSRDEVRAELSTARANGEMRVTAQ